MGFVKLQLIAKYEIFEQCHSAKKCKRDLLGFFHIHCVAKYRNKRRGDPSVESKKVQKKLHSAEKIRVNNTKGGILCFRGSGRRCFCFGRGSCVSSVFWMSVVQIDDEQNEQMNKQVDRTHLKKLPTVRVGLIFC